jgi:uncharacterized membrane protein
MNSDLIVMTFDRGEMAQTVYRALQAMRKSQVLGLDAAVILTRDGAGQIRQQPEPIPTTSAGLVGFLADLVFLLPGRAMPASARGKLDEEFVVEVRSALRNNGSALLFFTHPDSLGDTGEVLNALALFRGRIHQTTLTPQSEALLREML